MAGLKDQVYVELIAETTKSISNLARLVVAWGAVYLASKKVYAVLADLVNEAAEQEKADMKLAAGIRAVGKEGQISAGRLSDYASELQKATIYEDVATQEAMGLLIQIGNLSEKGIRQIIPLVQDMASALDMDLNTAAMLVAKTLGSDMNALGRYGIQLEKTSSPTEKLAALTKALDERFGGLAITMGETTVGKLIILQNQFKELKEQLGVELLPTINSVASALLGFFQNLSSFKSAKDILSPLGFQNAISNIDNARKAIEILNKEIKRTEDLLKTQGKYQGPERERLKQLEDRLLMLQQVIPLLEQQAKFEKKPGPSKSVDPATAESARKLADGVRAATDAWNEFIEAELEIVAGFPSVNNAFLGLTDMVGIFSDEIAEKGLIALENYQEAVGQTIDLTDKWNKELLKGIDYVGKYYEELDEKTRKAIEQAKELAAAQKEVFLSVLSTASSIAGSLGTIWDNYYKSKMEGMDKDSEEYKKLAREQAQTQKNMALFQATVDIAAGIVKALASSAPPFNFILAALVAAAGAVQIAAIASTPLPALAEGGVVTKPTTALIGERGPEAVIPLSKMGGFGGTRVVVHVHGSVLTERRLAGHLGDILARQQRGY